MLVDNETLIGQITPTVYIDKITDDVFNVSENNFPLDSEKIKKLVDEARKSSRKRARLCVHNDNDSNLHEMFIAKLKSTYVRPHKNHNKCKYRN